MGIKPNVDDPCFIEMAALYALVTILLFFFIAPHSTAGGPVAYFGCLSACSASCVVQAFAGMGPPHASYYVTPSARLFSQLQLHEKLSGTLLISIFQFVLPATLFNMNGPFRTKPSLLVSFFTNILYSSFQLSDFFTEKAEQLLKKDMWLRVVLLAMLLLHVVSGGPLMYAACLTACYGVAATIAAGIVLASGGAALGGAAVAGAAAGANGANFCLPACAPFLVAPGP